MTFTTASCPQERGPGNAAGGAEEEKQRAKQKARLKRTPLGLTPPPLGPHPPHKAKKATRLKSLHGLPSIPPNNNSTFGRGSVRSAVCDAFQKNNNNKKSSKARRRRTAQPDNQESAVGCSGKRAPPQNGTKKHSAAKAHFRARSNAVKPALSPPIRGEQRPAFGRVASFF